MSVLVPSLFTLRHFPTTSHPRQAAGPSVSFSAVPPLARKSQIVCTPQPLVRNAVALNPIPPPSFPILLSRCVQDLSFFLFLYLCLFLLSLPLSFPPSTLIIAAYVLLCIPISAKYMALIMHELCRAAAEEVAEGSTRWFGVFSFREYCSHFFYHFFSFSFSFSFSFLSVYTCVSLLIYYLSGIAEISCSRIFLPILSILHTQTHIHTHPHIFFYIYILSHSLSSFHFSSRSLFFLCRLKAADQRRNVYRR